MAVHAHPDDEASSTGGILARYSAEGIRTVLVTCTNGELGDALDGTKPGEPGHDGRAVARLRRQELEASCEILGVSELEVLGYHDSGMMGWSENAAKDAFFATPVAQAAQPLETLIERFRPAVVVTYDANGFYGHPDHIQAHRITMAAVEATRIPAKVYFPVFPKSVLPRFAAALREAGEFPDEAPPEDVEFGTPDEDIDAEIDCEQYVDRKRQALEAHRSQTAATFFMKLGHESFRGLFATEYFVRATSWPDTGRRERDLFAGLR